MRSAIWAIMLFVEVSGSIRTTSIDGVDEVNVSHSGSGKVKIAPPVVLDHTIHNGKKLYFK